MVGFNFVVRRSAKIKNVLLTVKLDTMIKTRLVNIPDLDVR